MAVFYSFYYQRDAWRVQQVANMGAVEGQRMLNSQQWEAVKRGGDQAIENWIAEQMKYKSAVVVLTGAQTASRPWVRYEITKAWRERRPLVGIRIHGLADRAGKIDSSGPNPFSQVRLTTGQTIADYVPLYTPSGRNSQAVYANISENLESWVRSAYKRT
jgi:hypothetical protein